MADTSDIENAISDDLLSGAESQQIGDRSITKMDPIKRMDALERLKSIQENRGAFFHYRLRGRT